MAHASKGKITAGEEEEDDLPSSVPPAAIPKPASSSIAPPAQPKIASPAAKAPAVGKVVFGEEDEEDTPPPPKPAKQDQPLETANPFVYNPDDKDIIVTPEKAIQVSVSTENQELIARRAPKSDAEKRLVQRNEAMRKSVAQKISNVYQLTHKNIRNSSQALNQSLSTFADAAQLLRQGNSELAQATGYFHDLSNNSLSILAESRQKPAA